MVMTLMEGEPEFELAEDAHGEFCSPRTGRD